MIIKPLPCPKCRRLLTVADDEYDAVRRVYVVKVYCDCGFSGIVEVEDVQENRQGAVGT